MWKYRNKFYLPVWRYSSKNVQQAPNFLAFGTSRNEMQIRESSQDITTFANVCERAPTFTNVGQHSIFIPNDQMCLWQFLSHYCFIDRILASREFVLPYM